VGCSGVRRTPSTFFGFEQAIGIDLSLERQHEGKPGRLGRLASVVGRVESVCTDPAAKGPTGPFCLVHLQMYPVLPWRCPTVRSVAPALLRSEALTRSPGCCSSRPGLRLTAPGAEFRRLSEMTLRPHQLSCKILCTLPGTCPTVRVVAAISCTTCLAWKAEPEYGDAEDHSREETS